MEYSSSDMSGVQQNYSVQSQDSSRSSGCNAQNPLNSYSGPEGSSSSRNYTAHPQSYPAYEYGNSQSMATPAPTGYQQQYLPDNHGNNLTLNQLLQQGNTSNTYQMRAMHNSQTPYRGYDPYGYLYKSNNSACTTQERSQGNVYPYPGPQRYADPYVRSPYTPYLPASYPHYHAQPMSQQRHRCSSQMEYNNVNTSSQPRPSQPATPTNNTNICERPLSRNIGIHNASTQSPQNLHSSPVISSGGCGSQPWSPHPVSFGSPHPLVNNQLQSRSHSLSRDYPNKHSADGGALEHNTTTNNNENALIKADEGGSRPHSRISEVGGSSQLANAGSKETFDDSISTLDNLIQNSDDGPICTTASSTPPTTTVSRNTPPVQSYQAFAQQPGTPSSPAANVMQHGSAPGPNIPPTSPNQTKSLGSNCQTPPLIRSQDPNAVRMAYPMHPHSHQLNHPPNMYPMGNRMTNFYPNSSYPMRLPAYPISCSANSMSMNRGPFPAQFSGGGPVSAGSMPPPAVPPASVASASTQNQQPPNAINNSLSHQPFISSLPYSSSVNSNNSNNNNNNNNNNNSNFGPPGHPMNAQPNWDQEGQCVVPGYQTLPSIVPHQFGGRAITSMERPSVYSPSPNALTAGTAASNVSQLGGGSYPPNQIPPPYLGHQNSPYPYSTAQQMLFHTHPQYSNLSYGPNLSGPPMQQHFPSSSTSASSYPSSGGPTPVGMPSSQHAQMSREAFNPPFGHDQPNPNSLGASVSATNETFPSFSAHPTNGSPSGSGLRPASNNFMKSSGKPGKPEGLSHSMGPGSGNMCPTPGSTPQNEANANVGPPQPHAQRRFPPSPNHPSLQHYPCQNAYSQGSGPLSPLQSSANAGPYGPQGSSHPFPGFQQHRGMNPHMHNATMGNVTASLPFGSMDAATVVSRNSLVSFHKLVEMGNEPERRPWLEHYVSFMNELGKPLVGLPQVVKQPLDLYRFYLAVRERGGVIEVIKNRKWKEVSQVVNINASASAAYTLRKNYCKFLLDYECRFDRGGADPRPIMAHIDALSGKKKKLGDSDSLQPPAPPSPSGSHSSASSSLLPPGSSGASLSGGPSGTAGSAASDSQHGPPSGLQQRFNDQQTQPGSVSTVPESPNTNIPSPASAVVASVSALNNSTSSSVSSHRPSSGLIVNGFSNSMTESNANWPWMGDTGNKEMHRLAHTPDLPTSKPPSSPMKEQSSMLSSRIPPASVSTSTFSVKPSLGMSVTMPTSSASMANSGLYMQQNATPYSIHGSQPGSVSQHLVNQTPNHNPVNNYLGSQRSSSAYPRLSSSSNNTYQVYRSPGFNMPVPTHGSDQSSMFRMQQQMRPHVSPYNSSANNNMSQHSISNANVVPAHLIHHHGGQRPGYVTTIFKRWDQVAFPPGSVEATQIDSSRHRRYRAKDLGSIAPFKLLMALKSGLAAEVSWALNCLNVLLRDEGGLDWITANLLPSLLTTLVEIWRHGLGELFNYELFIAKFELPMDLSLGQDEPQEEDRSTKAIELVNKVCFTTATKHHEPNGLIKLENEICQAAQCHGLPVSSIRTEIHRLMRRQPSSDDKAAGQRNMRVRNGLLLRFDTMPNANQGQPIASNTMTPDLSNTPTTTLSRSRKRGRNTTCVQSNPLSGSNAVVPPDYYSTINVKQDVSSLWASPQILNISDSLRYPEAISNLRQLAYYVMDNLTESNCPKLEKENVDNASPKKILTTKLLRQLMIRGGGDTTCHIMPPFGAKPLKDTHWTDGESKLPNLVEQLMPPSIKKSVNDKTNESDHDDDDQQLVRSSKRTRHCSTSLLSLQLIDDHCGEFDSKTADLSSNEGDRDCVDHADENGRCPLRARSELVYYGGTCLWPDSVQLDDIESRAVRCLCVSTVLRNLSFVGSVERHLSCQRGVLALVGRILLLGHEHVGPEDTWHMLDQKANALEPAVCAWRTPTWLEDMRENAMVLLVNVAGCLNLVNFDESIVRPILESLLHWITCPTAASVDPFPGHRTLSPRRLALEALNRLCVQESNVDLLLSTTSDETVLTQLFDRLANWLALPEDQVTRELALSTMHYLAGGGACVNYDKTMMMRDNTPSLSATYIGTTLLAHAKPCPVSGLVAFIEAAEATTRRVIDQCGVHVLQERPELMGTSLEMVRRAGALLDRLAVDSKGRMAFTPSLELRLMDLVTSRVLDATVAHLLCGALHRLLPETNLSEMPLKPSIPPIPSLSVVGQLLKLNTSDSLNISKTDDGNSDDHSDEIKRNSVDSSLNVGTDSINNCLSPNKADDSSRVEEKDSDVPGVDGSDEHVQKVDESVAKLMSANNSATNDLETVKFKPEQKDIVELKAIGESVDVNKNNNNNNNNNNNDSSNNDSNSLISNPNCLVKS